MNKKILLLLITAMLFFGCTQQQQNTLTIYTYDSMVSEYGLGPKVIPKFEEQCNCKVNLVAKGDAGAVLTTLELEKDSPKADIVIGIDNSLYKKAIEKQLLEKFTPKNIEIVPQDMRFDKEGYITPFDFGYIAFVYDSKKITNQLDSFESLLDPDLKKKIAIQHPRTSSPGLALLLWTVKVFGDPGYKEFWKQVKPNVLTVTDGWDESAGLFSAGEVPMYLSYATSPAYYAGAERKYNFVAAKFNEGHYLQVEGIAIVKGTKNRQLAEKFVEFSLTEDFQKEIPLTQYMFPINQSVQLPDAFEFALKPDKKLELDTALVDQKQEEWILEWEKIMSSG